MNPVGLHTRQALGCDEGGKAHSLPHCLFWNTPVPIPKIIGGVVHQSTVQAARKLVGRKTTIGKKLRSTTMKLGSASPSHIQKLNIPEKVKQAAIRDNINQLITTGSKAKVRNNVVGKLRKAGLMEKSTTRNGLRLKRG